VDGRVSSWFDHRYGPPTGIKVQTTICKATGPDEFGEVVSAFMVLSAKLLPSAIRYIAKTPSHLVQFSLLDRGDKDLSETIQDDFEPDYDIFQPGPDCILTGATVFLVQTFFELTGSRSNGNSVPHLVLIQTSALNTYKRIGILRIPTNRCQNLFCSVQQPTTFNFI
jgi:hypothetical protein